MNRRIAPLLLTVILTCCAVTKLLPLAAAQNVPNADLLQVKGELLKRVNQDKASIASNQALLARAQAAHQQALADNDSDGVAVTQQAIANALQALERAQQNLTDDQKRLDAVNQALVLWHSVGDSIPFAARVVQTCRFAGYCAKSLAEAIALVWSSLRMQCAIP